jgi:3-(3-hydroxy-phenyl)propionate hydroxylase
LLDSYQDERRAAAVENLAITDASMRFMVPHGPLQRLARNGILRGSIRSAFLRRLVNSGKLSQPFTYARSPVIAPPHGDDRLPSHGAVAPDVACTVLGGEEGGVHRLLDLVGEKFLLLLVCRNGADRAAAVAVRAASLSWPVAPRIAAVGPDTPLRGVSVLRDETGDLVRRYAPSGSRAWLIRPDGHLAGSVALPVRESVDELPGIQALALGQRQPHFAAPSRDRRERVRALIRQRARRAG